MNRTPWTELGHPRFDVEDGRSIDGIEALDLEGCTIDAQDAADGQAYRVRPILGSLGENANLWPFGVSPWLAHHVRLVPCCSVEQGDDLAVTEGIETLQRPPIERREQLDERCLDVPIVVDNVSPRGSDHADEREGG